MKNKKRVMGFGLLVAVLFLGIGYAAITSVNFQIQGTATATVDSAQFQVDFIEDAATVTKVGSNSLEVTDAKRIAPQTASFTATGFKAAGDKITVTYTVENKSEDLDAKLGGLTVNLANNNDGFFTAVANYGNGGTRLTAKGGRTTVTVTVELVKTPIGEDGEDLTPTITVNFPAEAVQPGA